MLIDDEEHFISPDTVDGDEEADNDIEEDLGEYRTSLHLACTHFLRIFIHFAPLSA
jgi:hypothetical protein